MEKSLIELLDGPIGAIKTAIDHGDGHVCTSLDMQNKIQYCNMSYICYYLYVCIYYAVGKKELKKIGLGQVALSTNMSSSAVQFQTKPAG